MILVHSEDLTMSKTLSELMDEVKAKEKDPKVRGMLGY
jgi:flagellar biosynthesis protein FlhB